MSAAWTPHVVGLVRLPSPCGPEAHCARLVEGDRRRRPGTANAQTVSLTGPLWDTPVADAAGRCVLPESDAPAGLVARRPWPQPRRIGCHAWPVRPSWRGAARSSRACAGTRGGRAGTIRHPPRPPLTSATAAVPEWAAVSHRPARAWSGRLQGQAAVQRCSGLWRVSAPRRLGRSTAPRRPGRSGCESVPWRPRCRRPPTLGGDVAEPPARGRHRRCA